MHTRDRLRARIAQSARSGNVQASLRGCQRATVSGGLWALVIPISLHLWYDVSVFASLPILFVPTHSERLTAFRFATEQSVRKATFARVRLLRSVTTDIKSHAKERRTGYEPHSGKGMAKWNTPPFDAGPL